MEANVHAEILENLAAIADIAQRWLTYLGKRLRRVRIAKASLVGLLTFFALVAVLVSVVRLQFSPSYFEENRGFILTLVGLEGLAGLLSGVMSYQMFKRVEDDPRIKELSELVERTKRSDEEPQTPETWLVLTDRFLSDLPFLVRRRTQDALLFGLVAFIVGSVIAQLPVGLVIGVAVWLYFRYETNRTYDQEISKLEEKKRIFEQWKSEFLETL